MKILLALSACAVLAVASFAEAGCGGGNGIFSGIRANHHSRRSDRLAARADFHANRASNIQGRRGVTVIVVQPQQAAPKALPK